MSSELVFGRYVPERQATKLKPRSASEAVVAVIDRKGKLASYRYAPFDMETGTCTVTWLGERYVVIERTADGIFRFQSPVPKEVDLEEPVPASAFLEE